MAFHTSPARLTFLSHAATSAQRRAAFPLDEELEKPDFANSLDWKAIRAQRALSGPEHRTRQTARALGLSAEISEDLRDCDYGSWRGLDLNEIQAQDPEGLLAWLTDPAAAPHGGESILQLIDRAGGWLERQRDHGHTLAVTHPAVIRAVIIHVLQAPPQSFWRVDIAPLSLTDLRFNGRAWTVRSSAQLLRGSDETHAD